MLEGQALLELLLHDSKTSNLASSQPLLVAPISFFPELLQGEPLVCAVGQAGSTWAGVNQIIESLRLEKTSKIIKSKN